MIRWLNGLTTNSRKHGVANKYATYDLTINDINGLRNKYKYDQFQKSGVLESTRRGLVRGSAVHLVRFKTALVCMFIYIIIY